MENIKINGYNDLQLNCYLYQAQNAKAVVQIIHGMQEHALRYDDFAKFLVSKGYSVLVSDLRGHGLTAKSPEYFGVGEKDIFAETVEDQIIINEYLKEQFNLPIYVFGHSYGSFITQKLTQKLPRVKKFVICGTANGSNPLYSFGGGLTNFLCLFGIKNKKARLVENMSINSYGKKFENGNWLSRDPEVWKKYRQDQFCGQSFPFSFYQSMFKNLTKLNKGIKYISKDTQILLIVGDKDPVGANAKQVIQLHNIYKKKGVNSTLKVYKDARHELLNELNKNEVYNDVIDFLEK